MTPDSGAAVLTDRLSPAVIDGFNRFDAIGFITITIIGYCPPIAREKSKNFML